MLTFGCDGLIDVDGAAHRLCEMMVRCVSGFGLAALGNNDGYGGFEASMGKREVGKIL